MARRDSTTSRIGRGLSTFADMWQRSQELKAIREEREAARTADREGRDADTEMKMALEGFEPGMAPSAVATRVQGQEAQEVIDADEDAYNEDYAKFVGMMAQQPSAGNAVPGGRREVIGMMQNSQAARDAYEAMSQRGMIDPDAMEMIDGGTVPVEGVALKKERVSPLPEKELTEYEKAYERGAGETAGTAAEQRRAGIGPYLDEPGIDPQVMGFINSAATTLATGPEAQAARESAARSLNAVTLWNEYQGLPAGEKDELNLGNVDAAIARSAARYLEPDRLSDADFDQIVATDARLPIEDARLWVDRIISGTTPTLTESERDTLLKIIEKGHELSSRMMENVAEERAMSLSELTGVDIEKLRKILLSPAMDEIQIEGSTPGVDPRGMSTEEINAELAKIGPGR